MTTYSSELAALGLDQKWLLKESKILIRGRVIKTASAFVPPPEPEEEDSADEKPKVHCGTDSGGAAEHALPAAKYVKEP